MFTSKDQIEASLRAAGVSAARAAALAAKAKPCVRLETFLPLEGEAFSLGTTKIGGRPDLPAGTEWPSRPPYPDAADRIADTAASVEGLRASNEKALAKAQSYASSREQIETQAKGMLEQVAPVAEARPLALVAQLNLAQIQGTNPLDPDIPLTGRLLFFYDAQQQP
ncbi:DUF1963 domain-containing protein [Inquilinus sp.]|jgi:hypothetical protein|uniref:DUF1963 domain-containing protein n=1 Tax=Inquilinus sp. TaxID=1932117 RepID=UPI003783AAD6